MEQESYPLKSCPHPRRLVQVNIGLWVSFQFFTRLAAVFAEEYGSFCLYYPLLLSVSILFFTRLCAMLAEEIGEFGMLKFYGIIQWCFPFIIVSVNFRTLFD